MTPDARDAPLLRLGVRHVLVLGVAGALGVAYASAYGVAVGAGAIAAVSVMLWTAVRPRTALLVIIGSAAPLSGLRRGFPVPFLRLGEALILGGALVTLLLVDRYHGAKWRSVEYFLTGYVVLTIVVGYWSMRRTGVAVTAENVGLLIVPAFHALAYFTAKGFGRHPDAVRQGLRLTLLGSIPITALGILQYVRAPFVGSFLKTFGDPTIFDQNVTAGYVARATGTFNHWHLLAGYLFVVVVLAVSLLLEDGQNVMTRRALVAVVAIDVVGLLLTLTYTAFIGVIGATILIGFSTGRGLKVLGHMALAAVESI